MQERGRRGCRGDERVKETGDKGEDELEALETRIPFLLPPCNRHTHAGHRQPTLLRSKGNSTLKPRLTGLGLPITATRSSPGSGSGAARPPVSVAPAHSWRRARGAGLGAARGRGTGAGEAAPGRWPEAWGVGGKECKADVRSQDGPGSSRVRQGGSAGPVKGLLGRGPGDVVPREGSGSPAPARRCQGTNDFPNLPTGPPETEWKVQEEGQGKPLPRTAARAGHSGGRNW